MSSTQGHDVNGESGCPTPREAIAYPGATRTRRDIDEPRGCAVPDRDITDLLRAAGQGVTSARDQLIDLVYAELRTMAHRRLPYERRAATLDTEALVHEAYLKLFGHESLEWQSRRHFFSVVAIAMRHIVVDHARQAAALKRHGGRVPVTLDESIIRVDEQSEQLLALDEALRRLELVDPRMAKIVELRFFVGLSIDEIARILEVSDRTVKREWRKARALLFEALA